MVVFITVGIWSDNGYIYRMELCVKYRIRSSRIISGTVRYQNISSKHIC